jgi:tetratricopeptide (TPR) repeat protein
MRVLRLLTLVPVMMSLTIGGMGREACAEVQTSRPASSSGLSDFGSPRFDLPDDGPRYDKPVKGPWASIFLKGVRAYQQHDFTNAEAGFRELLKQFPASPVTGASRAFLADILAAGRTDAHRHQAIEAYRALIRDNPASPNAARARWRIGDLYAEAGWFVEGKGAYEQALSNAAADRPRTLLGLGMIVMAAGQWKEAERIFQQVRTSTTDDRVLEPATFALADVLHAQERLEEAQGIYDTGAQRWLPFLKRHPRSLLSAAALKMRLKRYGEARRFYTLFYNLYPRHENAAAVLIRIGDTWRSTDRTDRARVAYAAAMRHGASGEAVARMRLAELGQDLVAQVPDHALRRTVGAMFEVQPTAIVDETEQQDIFRTIARSYHGTGLGNEALFHLGEHFELAHRHAEAVQAYRDLSDRKGQVPDDPWPEAAGRRLVALLSPWVGAALRARDDVTAMSLFYRHGRFAEDLYAASGLLLRLADAHRRSGFSPQAVKLYQSLLRDATPEPLREQALIGLGESYLNQHDDEAARRLFERYVLQYPAGQAKLQGLKLLAMTLDRQGEYGAVIRTCGQWLRHASDRLHSDRPDVLRMLATAQIRTGDFNEALQTFAEMAQADGFRDSGTLIRYAELLMRTERYEEAATQYLRVIHNSPSSSDDVEWARLQLVKARRLQGRDTEARALLQQGREAENDGLLGRVSSSLLGEMPEAESASGDL